MMNDNRIMELLKESGEEVKIPESLKPEAILQKLKAMETETEEKEIVDDHKTEAEMPEKKTPVIPFRRKIYQYGSWAAVAAVVLLGAAYTGPVLPGSMGGAKKEAEMSGAMYSSVSKEEAVNEMADMAEEEAVYEMADT
ncbi:MAG: hypothetical protein KBT01_00160, partial [Clostridiales bacterium]|nr:hypothetical protein [Candidatus Blautia equi]